MKIYYQSTEFTTAASSLLTIIHFFKEEIKLTKENEFDIWQKTVNLPTRASSIYALANYAKNVGLDPEVIVEKREYSFPDYRFYRYSKEDIEHAKDSSLMHLKKAMINGVKINEGSIDLNTVKGKLEKGKIIILRLNAKPFRNIKRNTSNYLVIHGFNEKYFQIIDPMQGGLSIPEEVMNEAFESLESKKYRDHRMILF